eukprot:CAMPEP_0194361602 /NCGR_PEP_ID=MMETSP0174-20130528/9149_1 /TAXON_ID=216777 /ORGANISM="Proboscia alata, Strain PI-D3" /LENGTH=269 /DNA_ID=CAMNT_0039133873 /DNA_START=76 /DNA_END=885 /DNA_ORIENTATION=-
MSTRLLFCLLVGFFPCIQSSFVSEEVIEGAINRSASALINATNTAFEKLDDPLPINESGYDSTGNVCLMSDPIWGGCICQGSASYILTLNGIDGLSNIRLHSATTSNLNISLSDSLKVSGSASFNVTEVPAVLGISGSVKGTVSACGVSFSETADMTASGLIKVATSFDGQITGCGKRFWHQINSAEVKMENVRFDVRDLQIADISVSGFSSPLDIFANEIIYGVIDLIDVLHPNIADDILNDLVAVGEDAINENPITTECVSGKLRIA